MGVCEVRRGLVAKREREGEGEREREREREREGVLRPYRQTVLRAVLY